MAETEKLLPIHVSRVLRRAGFGAQDQARGFGGFRCRADRASRSVWVTWSAPDSMYDTADKEEIESHRQHMLLEYRAALVKVGYSVEARTNYSLYVTKTTT